MRSTQVYRVLRQEVGPWARGQGFKRADSLLSWHRPHGDRHLVFWFQVWLDGFDQYAGSKFTLEFQLGAQLVVASYPATRARLSHLLGESDLSELRQIQNRVIGSLSRPSEDYLAQQESDLVREWYLGKFEPVTAPYTPADDVWFRYYSEQHVREWGRFILQRLPAAVAHAEGWG
jgi:hypothetical protein